MRATTYDADEVSRGLTEALDLIGGMDAFIKPGDRVLIKPNMLEGLPPEKAVTTHPAVVRAVIRAVKAAGGLPLVGDSPALGNAHKTAEKTGILDVCVAEGVRLSPFQETIEVEFPAGQIIKKFTLAKEFGEADKVISLAKMKTHSFMGITGGIKNLFGFIVGPSKAQYHFRMQKRSEFALMLIDLARRISPVLYIVDGITGMEGNGPRNGQPVETGVLIAGENGFAVDMVMSKIMGFEAERLPVSAKALAQGLVAGLADIEIVGSAGDLCLQVKAPKNLEALDDRIPSWAARLGQRQLTAKPLIADNCTNCGRCRRHCPPQAIINARGKAAIDYDKCIRCYCCQELCPQDAVYLQEGFVLRLVKKFCARSGGAT